MRTRDEYQALLDEWVGTPYMIGGWWKGKGVDCLRFTIRILDDLYGLRHPTHLGSDVNLPSDAALHDKKSYRRVIRFLLTRFACTQIYHKGDKEIPALQPGDVIVCEIGENAPGHIMIVGADPARIYHSASGQGGVDWTGIGCPKTQGIHGIWRSRVPLVEMDHAT